MTLNRTAIAVLLCLAASGTAAQDARKEQLAEDPKVRESLPPENTPLGRNPPQSHTGGTDAGLQKAIDEAHKGTTGTTTQQGTRSPGNQPEGLKDGQAPRITVPAK